MTIIRLKFLKFLQENSANPEQKVTEIYNNKKKKKKKYSMRLIFLTRVVMRNKNCFFNGLSVKLQSGCKCLDYNLNVKKKLNQNGIHKTITSMPLCNITAHSLK